MFTPFVDDDGIALMRMDIDAVLVYVDAVAAVMQGETVIEHAPVAVGMNVNVHAGSLPAVAVACGGRVCRVGVVARAASSVRVVVSVAALISVAGAFALFCPLSPLFAA